MCENALKYGKTEAQMIAGVAIVMMLVHHFFGFADYRLDGNWIYEPVKIGGVSLERIFASAGKLCVAIFAFSSGYAIWVNRKSFAGYKSIGKRALKFLLNYWIILAAFLTYALIIGDNIPAGRDFIHNIYGVGTGPHEQYVNVAFAWYVVFYVSLLLTTPLLISIFNRTNGWWDMTLLLCFALMPTLIGMSFLSKINAVPIEVIFGTLVSSIVGLLVAKWKIFDRMRSMIGNYALTKGFFIATFVLILRQIGLLTIGQTDISDALFAMLFCFGLLLMFEKINGTRIARILSFLGIYSMNLWFLHGIFLSGTRPLQAILYYPRVSILILIWGLILLIPVAMLFAWIQKHAWNSLSKLRIKSLSSR